MESVAFIQWCLDHLNYWTITLLMAIESSFIPFPSEVVVPPAAYKAASENSNLNVYLVILFATIGANIGALINYYLAYFVGRPIVYKFANSRFGRARQYAPVLIVRHTVTSQKNSKRVKCLKPCRFFSKDSLLLGEA